MKTTEEKAYYLSIMKTAIEERRELTTFIMECKNRISELDKLEKMGIGQIKTETVVELYNQKQADKLPEPKNTIAKAASNIGSAFAAMGKGMNEALKEAAATKEKEIQGAEPVKSEPVQEKKKKRGGATHGVSRNKTNSMIYYVMQQAGKPIHIEEIYKHVVELYKVDVTLQSFRNNWFSKAKADNDQIISTARGVYFYQA
jgi:hypothetical protein